MANPTQRATSSRRKRRNSHAALKKPGLIACPKCKKPIMPHRACKFCGTYKGNQVLTTKKKTK